MIRKINGKIVSVVATSLVLASHAMAADPTELSGFGTVATDGITTGKTIAIAAAGLSMGWTLFTIVKSYTGRARK